MDNNNNSKISQNIKIQNNNETILLEYPFYKNLYVLDTNKIKNLVENFIPNIKILSHVKNVNLEKFKENQGSITKNILSLSYHRTTQKYNTNTNMNKNKYVIIEDKWNDNYELNSLTDYFSENMRILCKFGKEPTPQDAWINYTEKIKIISPSLELREHFYSKIKMCNNFRISVALTVLKIFRPQRWLDISCGWGDRLLAAILYDVELYYSVDPNKKLHKCYKEIIKTFVPKSKQNNFIVKKTGFENVIIPTTVEFDLVFSSPPFFDLEKYSTDKNDSLTRWGNDENSWADNFLIPCVIKAGLHLRVGGTMVLYFSASRRVMKRLFDALTINNFIYNGIIYFHEKKFRGMYIWTKNKK